MKYFTTIIFFLGLLNLASAQSTWTNYYYNNFFNSVNAIDTTNDKGYFIVGGTKYHGSGGDYFAYKIDSSGNEIWNLIGNKYNGFNYENSASCVINTEDGGCLIGGIILNLGVQNLYFIRVNSSGQVLWDKYFGGNHTQLITAIIKNGNNYLCACISFSNPSNTYLLALNSNGDSLWSKNVNIGLNQLPSALIKGLNGNFILFGSIEDTIINHSNLAYLEIDSLGNTLDSKMFPDTSTRSASTINQTPDSGFLFSSYSWQYHIAYLTKTSKTGSVVWEKVFYNANTAVSTIINENNYLMSVGRFNPQISVILIDSLGNIQRYQNFQTWMLQSELNDNIFDNNGGVLLCGSVRDLNYSTGIISKIYLSGFNSINDISNNKYDDIKIYPNPINIVQSDLMIKTNNEIKCITILNSYNQIMFKVNSNELASVPILNFNLNSILSSGVFYLVFDMGDGYTVIKRLIVSE